MPMIRKSLLIGINGYAPSIGELQFCVSDARGVARALNTRREGFDSTETTLLVDGGDSPPTRTNIINHVAGLCKAATAEDTLFIFFAGHGDVGDDGNLYLLPLDASPLSLDQTGIAWRWLENALQKSRATKKILVLDACHSGTGRKLSLSNKTLARSSLVIETIQQSASDFVCMTSCGGGQLSYELKDIKQGIFSYYLAMGISGAADRLGRGVIDLESLYEFVRDRTLRHARRLQVEQEPRIIAKISSSLGAINLAEASLDRPINRVLVLSEDALIGPLLKTSISQSEAARGAAWVDDVEVAIADAYERFDFDAVYIDVGSGWPKKRDFILLVREHYPVVPFVLVGSRLSFLRGLEQPEKERFSNYFFLDVSTPLSGISRAVDDTLAQVEWDIRARYGEQIDA
jgi:hypothetical protein